MLILLPPPPSRGLDIVHLDVNVLSPLRVRITAYRLLQFHLSKYPSQTNQATPAVRRTI